MEGTAVILFVAHGLGTVSAKGQDVLYVLSRQFFAVIVQGVFLKPYAGEMCQRLNALFLDI